MSKNHPRCGGFTIIELMMIVGLIGIIATIAIPGFIRFQLRTKAAEGRMNIAGIRVAQEAYFTEFGVYASALPVVPAAVGAARTPWSLAAADPHGFNRIGFRPQGPVHFQYGVTTGGIAAYTIEARADIDGDGNFSTFGYLRPDAGATIGIAGPFGTCPTSGALDSKSGLFVLLQEAGPCDAASGMTVF